MRISRISEVVVGYIKQQGEVKECFVVEVLDESVC